MGSSHESQDTLVRLQTTESVPRGDIFENHTKPIGGEGTPSHYQEHVSAEDFRDHFAIASIGDSSLILTPRDSIPTPDDVASLEARVIENVRLKRYDAAKAGLEELIRRSEGPREPSRRVLRMLKQSDLVYDPKTQKVSPVSGLLKDKPKLYKAIFQAVLVYDLDMLDVLQDGETVDDNLPGDNYIGWTSLTWAAHTGTTECVKLLIEKGANVNKKVELKPTSTKAKDLFRSVGPLKSVAADKKDSIKDPRDAYWEKFPETMINYPLHAAAIYGQKSAVSLLLEKGADVNATNEKGDTALHLALGYSRNTSAKWHHVVPMAIADILIKHGANIEAKDKHGNTPLHAGLFGKVVRYGEFVEYMLSKGADINSRNNVQATPLIATLSGTERVKGMKTTKTDLNLYGVDIMLKHGADVNAVTNRGYNVLHYAASTSNTAVVKLLLDNGAQVNSRATSSELPLTFAVRFGHYQTAKLLVQHGAEVNLSMKDIVQPTFVFSALYAKNKDHLLDILRLLILEKGADVNNARDNRGNTALHVVAWNGMTECAKVLIQGGAYKDPKNNDGWTPLKCAKKQSQKATASYLSSVGCKS